jgi:hypothetical protein
MPFDEAIDTRLWPLCKAARRSLALMPSSLAAASMAGWGCLCWGWMDASWAVAIEATSKLTADKPSTRSSLLGVDPSA